MKTIDQLSENELRETLTSEEVGAARRLGMTLQEWVSHYPYRGKCVFCWDRPYLPQKPQCRECESARAKETKP